MSNCIDIRRETVVFRPSEIDSTGLKKLVDAGKKVDYRRDWREITLDEKKADCAWWFLCHENTTFHADGSVTVRFGYGRSSHTWRDFGAVLSLLSEFVLQSKKHTFMVEDEGFPGWGPLPVDLKSPKV